MNSSYAISDFHTDFPNEISCIDKVFQNRFGSLNKCPKCENEFQYYKVQNRKSYKCKYCSNQIHPLAGTIFHKSETNLKLWFYAIYLFATYKEGVSAKELQRQLPKNTIFHLSLLF